MQINEMRQARAKHLAVMKAIIDHPGETTTQQDAAYDVALAAVKELDKKIERARTLEESMAKAARPIGGGSYATVKSDPYEKDASLSIGGFVRMIAKGRGNMVATLDAAQQQYGEGHPVFSALAESKALNTITGSSGGFAVPPDFADEMIPLLYARTVVRKAGATTMPMPNGTMTIPKMISGSAASWVGETKPIGESAPSFGQVVANAHKLAALVPISNEQLRYASPQFDAQVRDDIVAQMALAEDAAFIRSLGTQYSPRGLKSFALAGQKLASASVYTLATANSELAQMVNTLEMANLPLSKVGWLMSPRTKNYLLNLLNSNGFPVYKAEMTGQGTLMGYPFFSTTAIPINLTVGGNSDTSEIYLVDFAQAMILESRQMEFAISTEGSYVDASGNTQSAFQNDLTIMRAVVAEDFQMRHDEAIVLNTGVRWASSTS